jgi:linoleoyl-CoA desaturase
LLYGVIFSVSHVNEKALFNHNETNFEKIQLNETADWSPGSKFWNYITNGLNHQVVHHLKSNISSFHYPEISAKISEQYGENYKTFKNILYAIKSNYNYMKKLGNFKCTTG